MRIRVKICCISSHEEAARAISAGADALGLVGDMPSGPGVIDDELARDIARATPPPVSSFLLTSRERGADIADHVRHCETSAIQIVRHIEPGEYDALIRGAPAVRRVQVIHVEDAGALDLIEAYEPFVHAFLLDSGRPSAPTAEFGGTGRVHDWTVSEAFVRKAGKPVFLAGGLSGENVSAAIARVRPYGVDLCSGVRTNGALDSIKLGGFMSAVGASPANEHIRQ